MVFVHAMEYIEPPSHSALRNLTVLDTVMALLSGISFSCLVLLYQSSPFFYLFVVSLTDMG